MSAPLLNLSNNSSLLNQYNFLFLLIHLFFLLHRVPPSSSQRAPASAVANSNHPREQGSCPSKPAKALPHSQPPLKKKHPAQAALANLPKPPLLFPDLTLLLTVGIGRRSGGAVRRAEQQPRAKAEAEEPARCCDTGLEEEQDVAKAEAEVASRRRNKSRRPGAEAATWCDVRSDAVLLGSSRQQQQ
ncbi:hypothetical protein PIB30_048596 [Stylosanthes scabra]|uniref:Uncharacterized protein n=1 Tax=Stylosanthes scabra TaxID=79078 RepID=A0ABU6ZFY4_9FABA|nr:hypothetical protein [Stylosanthes scabra]